MTWDQFEKIKAIQSKTAPIKMPTFSLADHDKHYHPHGWKPGQKCSVRNVLEKKDASDKIREPARPDIPESDEMAKNTKEVRAVDAMRRLATKWHKGVYRKGPEHLEYIVHPTAVVDMLKSWGYNEQDNPVTLGVAWGHDLIEDTKVPHEDIVKAGNHAEAGLGDKILEGIKTLSFDAPKEFKTKEEYDKIKDEYLKGVADKAPADILAVKIADRLNNSLDFAKAENPWGKTYLAKGEQFFKRVNELKNPEAVQKTIDEVKAKVAAIPEPKPIPVPKYEKMKDSDLYQGSLFDDDLPPEEEDDFAWLDDILANDRD